MAMETKKQYELVADKIIEQLKAGVAPWQKPWNNSGTDFQMPFNAVTNTPYKGLNALYLNLFSPFQDPRWATFKQAQSQDWQVQKGAKGFMINFVKTHDLVTKLDENKRPILENGNPIKIKVQLKNPIVTKAWVFNAEQIKGIPDLPIKEEKGIELWEKIIRAENIVNTSGVKIDHIQGNEAFYAPLSDKISMPGRFQFETADRYYSTLLHELGHWTGHHSRLDRDLVNKFGTPDYAREELRAEIASMILGNELKIGHDPSQHLAYVGSWIKLLTDTPYEIHAAAADAQRIFDYVMAFEKKIILKEDTNLNHAYNSQVLQNGEIIQYNQTSYKVLQDAKKGLIIQDLSNDHKIPLKQTDGLYNSLIQAKQNSHNLTPKSGERSAGLQQDHYSIPTGVDSADSLESTHRKI